MIPLPILTFWFFKFCKGRFESQFRRFPLEVRHNMLRLNYSNSLYGCTKVSRVVRNYAKPLKRVQNVTLVVLQPSEPTKLPLFGPSEITKG